ncbi:hypothetical protein OGAPHI_000765 [Ogataea philodendri]|uniref:Ketopantoate reductase C-terminal domain-containing protein n=1 Tax=Ogataea philodendri TaxID=1378263 RepID=A0A9P8PGX4_9ASCO|nr:uncharacterized protein OGAPHI_000765 [Ogataea philodendri]KAH3671054.1 hypothetical protein OGAPHI_000765 [Ogataea philodendri]
MTSRYNVLSVGSHPNLAFYNWRLFSSKTCDLTVVSPTTKANNTFHWTSLQFGNSRYSLSTVYDSLDAYLAQTEANGTKLAKIDYIFVSAVSLQDLASIFGKLVNVIASQLAVNNVPTIIVESTNFVNLEPFVKLSMQLDVELPVLSIMSDYDIRLVGDNNYEVYKSKKESDLLYVGRSGTQDTYSKTDIRLINEISDLFESAGIDVYKLSTPLEFLSYQWKFALPKIAIEPLSILFEKPFPDQLQEQILAKPLISGLISEIISVIKTMGCKLFKSYDSESSLLQRIGQLYPVTKLSPDYSEAPKLFYDFYNQNEIHLDLLLLQPILIADDFHIKTPYLEFLYAMMTQFSNSNISTLDNETSIFWLRRNADNIRNLKLQRDEISVKNDLKEKEIAESKLRLAQPIVQPPIIPATIQPSPPASQQSQPSQADRGAFNFENKEYLQPHDQRAYDRAYQNNSDPALSNGSAGMNGSSASGGDQNIESDLEELSQMAHAYVIADQPPAAQNSAAGYQPKPIPSIYSQQRETQQLPPAAQPYYQQPAPQTQQAQQAQQYQQYQQQQQAAQQAQYQQQYQQYQQQPFSVQPAQPAQPVPPAAPGPEYYNGSSSPTYVPQQGLPQGLPSQGLPNQQQIFPPKMQGQQFQGRRQSVPLSYTQDNLSMFSGMNGHQGNYDNGDFQSHMSRQASRQFKPTSRKNRKSTTMINGPILGNDTRGMPSRHSMMPSYQSGNGSSNTIPTQQYTHRQSSSGTLNTMPRRSQTSNGLGINGAQKPPKPQQQVVPPVQPQSTGGVPPQAQQYPAAPVASAPVASFSRQPTQTGLSGEIASGSGSGSNSSLLASQQDSNLRPVPKATPAPNTPAYTPPSSEPKEAEKKKKKRGFFGRKK